MEDKRSLKQINTLFILRMSFAIIGILLAVFCAAHNKIIVVHIEELEAFFTLLVIGIILILVSSIYNKYAVAGIGAFFILGSLSFLPECITIDIDNTPKGIILSVTVISVILFCTFYMVYAFFERKKENKKQLLIFKISGDFWNIQNAESFAKTIKYYWIIKDDLAYFNQILNNNNDKNTFNQYVNKLHSETQLWFRNSILKNYETIFEALKVKQLNLANDIYDISKSLRQLLNENYEEFNEDNKQLSLTIGNKLDLIIAFISRYKNVYDTNVKYNIDEMDGHDFERYCANLLIGYGFVNVDVTKGSGDQGVDIIGWYGGYKYAIQCKRYSHKLGNTPIQEESAGKNYYGCQVGLVITNNYFTEGAIALAKANNVQLWNRDKLMSLIYFTDNQWDKLLEKIKLDISEE